MELHLGLTYEIDGLRERFGGAEVLGAIWFDEQLIRVDHSLDPHKNPQMLGRYNFTLAHEIGHWRLHREHFATQVAQGRLFLADGQPAFVCRAGDDMAEEVQANKFASYLLMPREWVIAAWKEWRGDVEPVALTDLEVEQIVNDRASNNNITFERFCKPLVQAFGVSAQAMRYRLQKLGLLVNKTEPRLF